MFVYFKKLKCFTLRRSHKGENRILHVHPCNRTLAAFKKKSNSGRESLNEELLGREVGYATPSYCFSDPNLSLVPVSP